MEIRVGFLLGEVKERLNRFAERPKKMLNLVSGTQWTGLTKRFSNRDRLASGFESLASHNVLENSARSKSV